jgi:GNAT superfamily N-acetyltransferase
VGVDGVDDRWLAAAAERLAIGFRDDTIAAFVVDHPEAERHCVSAAAVSIQQRLPTPPNPGGRTAYVQWVATDVEFRRRGLGRAVMESVVTWCSARGVGSVDLHASRDGDPLYRDLGFVPSRNPELRYFF